MGTLILAVLAAGVGPGAAPPAMLVTPEKRALAFLSREVPLWAKKNRCYSCHNNGDAARALYAAVRLGRSIPPEALADTTVWLEHPGRWDHNGGKGGYSDKKLARLQFAAALAEADATRRVNDRRALELASQQVVALQEKDGSWRVVPDDVIGSPTTHGTALATHLARRTLLQIGVGPGCKQSVARADGWLRKAPIDNMLDAAAVLLALAKAKDPPAVAQKRRCLERIRKGESRRGGWGPYVQTSPEVFDTAVVLLALASQEQTAEVKTWIRRGLAYLLDAQEKDGGWPETTRPSGSDSYALRLSTTGWAVMALLAVRAADPVRK